MMGVTRDPATQANQHMMFFIEIFNRCLLRHDSPPEQHEVTPTVLPPVRNTEATSKADVLMASWVPSWVACVAAAWLAGSM